jgi:hypothetical protein
VLLRSHVLYFLWWVRSFGCYYLNFVRLTCARFAAVSFFYIGLLSPRFMVRQFVTDICKLDLPTHKFYRAQLLSDLVFITVFTKWPSSRRCLSWDHALCSAFEIITLSWWPSLTKELRWLQSPSRSADTQHRALMCSRDMIQMFNINFNHRTIDNVHSCKSSYSTYLQWCIALELRRCYRGRRVSCHDESTYASYDETLVEFGA